MDKVVDELARTATTSRTGIAAKLRAVLALDETAPGTVPLIRSALADLERDASTSAG